MIRKNRRLLNFLNGLADVFLNILAVILAYVTRFAMLDDSSQIQPYNLYLIVAIVYGVLSAFLYSILRIYTPSRNRNYIFYISGVLRANIIGILVLGIGLYFVRFVDFSRLALAFCFLYSTVIITAKHCFVYFAFKKYRAAGYNKRYILLIGTGNQSQQYINTINRSLTLGLEVSGYVRCRDSETLDGAEYLGDISNLDKILSSHQLDQVVISLCEQDTKYTKAAINSCNKAGIRFSIIPFFSEYIFSASSPTVETIGNIQTFDFSASPLDLLLNKSIKRLMDIIISLIMLVVLSPVMLIAVIGVKLSSPGPIAFKQERVGRDKNSFYIYKFRSMRINDEENTGWSCEGDPRVTKFGNFMRKTNIDELPQLLNVLKGDMSLIGPRPEIPYHVGHFKQEIPYYMARHQIRPGMTGWAQVNGFRGDTSIEERVKYDLQYIYNWSLLFDIEILLKTLFTKGT